MKRAAVLDSHCNGTLENHWLQLPAEVTRLILPQAYPITSQLSSVCRDWYTVIEQYDDWITLASEYYNSCAYLGELRLLETNVMPEGYVPYGGGDYSLCGFEPGTVVAVPHFDRVSDEDSPFRTLMSIFMGAELAV